MPVGWRICVPEYASEPDVMLSGDGSYLYGGRWSSRGVRVVYLGTSLAQAGMELLVHLGRADVLNTYMKMPVTFPGEVVEHIDPEDLPDDWMEASMAPSVQAIGDEWVASQESVILQVPSVAVPGEFNYLLNPAHSDMSELNTGDITAFKFDGRLLK